MQDAALQEGASRTPTSKPSKPAAISMLYWVPVKELNSSYYIGETRFLNIHIFYVHIPIMVS